MSIQQTIDTFSRVLVNPALLLIFAVALLYFMWGMFIFVTNANDETARKKGLNHIFWGIIGMAIIVSARGIYAIVANTIGPIR